MPNVTITTNANYLEIAMGDFDEGSIPTRFSLPKGSYEVEFVGVKSGRIPFVRLVTVFGEIWDFSMNANPAETQTYQVDTIDLSIPSNDRQLYNAIRDAL